MTDLPKRGYFGETFQLEGLDPRYAKTIIETWNTFARLFPSPDDSLLVIGTEPYDPGHLRGLAGTYDTPIPRISFVTGHPVSLEKMSDEVIRVLAKRLTIHEAVHHRENSMWWTGTRSFFWRAVAEKYGIDGSLLSQVDRYLKERKKDSSLADLQIASQILLVGITPPISH